LQLYRSLKNKTAETEKIMISMTAIIMPAIAPSLSPPPSVMSIGRSVAETMFDWSLNTSCLLVARMAK